MKRTQRRGKKPNRHAGERLFRRRPLSGGTCAILDHKCVYRTNGLSRQASLKQCGDMKMTEAFLCDAIRTPIGRYAGSLSSVRADDLGAVPLKALIERNKEVDWNAVDDLIYGCANQAGEAKKHLALKR